MIVNETNLALVFAGLKTVYSEAGLNAPQHAAKIAMTVPSSSRDETCGWFGMDASLRERLGPRVIANLQAHSFVIRNKLFERAISMRRVDFEDDRPGTFAPAFAELGEASRRHPEELVFGLLKAGFDTLCFDGQNFFAAIIRSAGKTARRRSSATCRPGPARAGTCSRGSSHRPAAARRP